MTISDSAAQLRQSPPFRFSMSQLLWAVAIVGAGLAMLLPIFRAMRNASEEYQCQNNLKMIAMAMRWYHDMNGNYPPAYLAGPDGTPWHSWRTILWPYMESRPKPEPYRLDEPWNGPNNSKLAQTDPLFSRCPLFYRCPGDSSPPQMTSYVVVIGDETMWTKYGYMRMADVADGPSHTILVLEIANSDIHWMEPRDLPIAELEEWLDPSHKPTLLHSHRQGSITGGIVVFADGHTEFLPHDIAIERLRELLSRANRLQSEAAGKDD
jgi:hypothetical protein